MSVQFRPVGNPRRDIAVEREDRRATRLGLIQRVRGRWIFNASRMHPTINTAERAEVERFLIEKNQAAAP